MPGPRSETRSTAVVATPHHLASEVGRQVLRDGGNALDAAVAANLALGVVAPYFCGPGGDLFAVVWDGQLHGYLGAGRAPRGVTREELAARHEGRMPFFGADSVTVPGAVDGWFALLERWGSRSFAELAAGAIALAEEGFTVGERAAREFVDSRAWYGNASAWTAHYGQVDARTRFVQPAAARMLRRLGEAGAEGFYRGPVADAIVSAIEESGGGLRADDLAAHEGEWCEPLVTAYRGVTIAELPPPTQGTAVLETLRILDGLELPAPGAAREHVVIEAVKLALVDRDRWISDPDAMPVPAESLLTDEHVASRRALLDPTRAADPEPGRPQPGGTAYLCAADGDGLLVSLIQSNFAGFGSGVHVADWGINLHNRGASFSLEPAHVNAFEPGKRPLHTLIPAMALRDGRPWLVFGTMGGDAQAQVHVQLLARTVDEDREPAEALASPRWRVDPGTWRLHIESRVEPEVVAGLRARGHRTTTSVAWDSTMGHAHAIRVDPSGYLAASDPRSEGAALGV